MGGAKRGARMLTSLVKVETYFSEVNAGSVPKYVPRSVQIDLEAGVCDRVRILHCASTRPSFRSCNPLRYVLVLLADCSNRTRSSLGKVAPVITGQKAVRPPSSVRLYSCSRCGDVVYTDGEY